MAANWNDHIQIYPYAHIETDIKSIFHSRGVYQRSKDSIQPKTYCKHHKVFITKWKLNQTHEPISKRTIHAEIAAMEHHLFGGSLPCFFNMYPSKVSISCCLFSNASSWSFCDFFIVSSSSCCSFSALQFLIVVLQILKSTLVHASHWILLLLYLATLVLLPALGCVL